MLDLAISGDRVGLVALSAKFRSECVGLLFDSSRIPGFYPAALWYRDVPDWLANMQQDNVGSISFCNCLRVVQCICRSVREIGRNEDLAKGYLSRSDGTHSSLQPSQSMAPLTLLIVGCVTPKRSDLGHITPQSVQLARRNC